MTCSRCGSEAVVKRDAAFYCGKCAVARDWEDVIAVVQTDRKSNALLSFGEEAPAPAASPVVETPAVEAPPVEIPAVEAPALEVVEAPAAEAAAAAPAVEMPELDDEEILEVEVIKAEPSDEPVAASVGAVDVAADPFA